MHSLPWNSGQQRVSPRISLVEGKGIEPWWEEGELEDTQGLPPSGSRTIHPYKEEVRELCQEAFTDEQGAPRQTQTGSSVRMEAGKVA